VVSWSRVFFVACTATGSDVVAGGAEPHGSRSVGDVSGQVVGVAVCQRWPEVGVFGGFRGRAGEVD